MSSILPLAFLLGFRVEGTGGNCVGLVFRIAGGELVVSSADYSLPVEEEPVSLGWYGPQEIDDSFGWTEPVWSAEVLLSVWLTVLPDRVSDMPEGMEGLLECLLEYADSAPDEVPDFVRAGISAKLSMFAPEAM